MSGRSPRGRSWRPGCTSARASSSDASRAMKYDRGWLPGAREVEWIESLSRPLSPTLAAIGVASPEGGQRIPIVDRDSGRVLAALAVGRRRIVEVGTAYGFSTLLLPLGPPEEGTVVTID